MGFTVSESLGNWDSLRCCFALKVTEIKKIYGYEIRINIRCVQSTASNYWVGLLLLNSSCATTKNKLGLVSTADSCLLKTSLRITSFLTLLSADGIEFNQSLISSLSTFRFEVLFIIRVCLIFFFIIINSVAEQCNYNTIEYAI